MRYLPGILMAQVIAASMIWFNHDRLMTPQGWLPVVLPSVVVALVIGFWFTSLSRRASAKTLEKATRQYQQEREQIRVKAEQAKARVEREAHKSITREARKTHARANLKVGAALTAAVAFGVLMMFTQLASLGLILLSGAGGALAGYMGRFKRHNKSLTAEEVAELPAVNSSKRISLPRFGRKKP